jgi:hypothetical protein
MEATTFLYTSSQSEVFRESYGPPKSQKSQVWEFRNSHLGVSGQKKSFGYGPRGEAHNIL